MTPHMAQPTPTSALPPIPRHSRSAPPAPAPILPRPMAPHTRKPPDPDVLRTLAVAGLAAASLPLLVAVAVLVVIGGHG